MCDELIMRFLGNKEEVPMISVERGVPKRSDGKIRPAVSVVPAEYWMFHCWTFQKVGN